MKAFFSILVLMYLFCYNCPADTVAKYGGSISKPEEKFAATKVFFLGIQDHYGPFVTQYEGGAWFDNSGLKGHSSSVLTDASVGVHVNAGALFGQALVGPAILFSPDEVLGGPFQFNNDIAFGLVDENTKATIGISYKHISSAGIESPNKGRDFLMFRVSLPWN